MTVSKAWAGRDERWLQRGALIVLILAFFAQLALGSTQLSLTSDEPPHAAHGYLLLSSGDTWALTDHRHPPLLNVWTAWPLLLQPSAPDVTVIGGWQEDFVIFVRNLWPQLGPVDRWALATRVPNMLLGILLMALVHRWTRFASGRVGALAAALVMAFDPLMVAHAQLNTTDVGSALITFGAIYGASRFRLWDVSPWRRAGLLAAVGALVGAAAAAKGSGIILAPITIAILFWREGQRPDRRESLVQFGFRTATLTIIVLTVAFAALWATYGFRLEPVTGSAMRLPLVAHTRMVRLILSESRRVAFLMGEIRWGGWWWYFPFAFLVKTPLPLIVLLGGALITLLRRPKDALSSVGLWLYPTVYVGTSILSGMNIGYRHLLSVFPFAYVAIGLLVQSLAVGWRRFPFRNTGQPRMAMLQLLAAGLLAWQAVETLSVWPYALSYFNQIVGGPENGYEYLVDSNYDWGQSFKALSTYLAERDIDLTWLSYYTWIDPAVYGVPYRPLPPAYGGGVRISQPYDPLPGIYALSATPLQGVMLADPDTYDWFRHREPIAQPGYGVLVYDVPERTVPSIWLAQCTVPATPLSQAAIEAGFGRTDLRTIAFDCTKGWVWPDGGATRGWYAIHAETMAPQQGELSPYFDEISLSYQQREPRTLPAFSLYERDPGRVEPVKTLEQVQIGPLTLLGFSSRQPAVTPGETFLVATWWRVDEVPNRPLSLMLHVGQPEADIIGVGDGLAVPREVWAAGDVLVQHHEVQIPTATAPGRYEAITGVYWLDTLERLPVKGSSSGETNLKLLEVEVGGSREN